MKFIKLRSLRYSAKSQNIQQLVVRCIQLSILTPCSKHVGVCVRGGCLQSLIKKNLIDIIN